jgi:hypothetical protein
MLTSCLFNHTHTVKLIRLIYCIGMRSIWDLHTSMLWQFVSISNWFRLNNLVIVLLPLSHPKVSDLKFIRIRKVSYLVLLWNTLHFHLEGIQWFIICWSLTREISDPLFTRVRGTFDLIFWFHVILSIIESHFSNFNKVKTSELEISSLQISSFQWNSSSQLQPSYSRLCQ